ncbi:hypothetical protein ACIQMR_12975 [Streptomyces sp. NPDC091376]|uniref:hypothetical protein n=1 Tax=Streptomyces sp. NPDC091376 TaxID=3365994 RepID=UPI003801B2D9
MVSVTRAAHNIEITAESLQVDLNRLEVQKQALERELAAVVAHLDSVQRALGALKALALDTAGAAAGGSAGATGSTAAGPDRASAPVVPQTDMSSSRSAKVASKTGTQAKTGTQVQRSESRKSAARPNAAAADAERHSTYGRLTEQIVEYFATVGDADVRARDVAAALGRDADSGSINAVRSTLDRLVGASRIRRTGRGLYRAVRS